VIRRLSANAWVRLLATPLLLGLLLFCWVPVRSVLGVIA